jgi:hypothetical protein
MDAFMRVKIKTIYKKRLDPCTDALFGFELGDDLLKIGPDLAPVFLGVRA